MPCLLRHAAGIAPALLIAVTVPQAAHAESAADRYWLEGSWYWPSADTKVLVEDRVSGEEPTVIDLESDLGFKRDDSLPEFRAGAKLGGGFRLIAEYLAINRKAEAELERTIGFGRFTFDVAANVKSTFETDIYRIGIGWDALSGDTYAVGVVGGLHATDFRIRLAGEASVDDASVGVVDERRSALAPLPTVGAYGMVDVLPELTLAARVDYIDLTLNNAGGRLINAEVSLTYNITENVGIGVGYRHVDYKLEMVKRDWTGSIDYNFDGPKIVLKAALR